jgi:hypothetical protein
MPPIIGGITIHLRCEVDDDLHTRDGVGFDTHHRQFEAVNDVLGAHANDHRTVDLEVEVIERDDVVFCVRIGKVDSERVRGRD